MPIIVFEGLDNSGKSTMAHRLAAKIPNAIVVREPGGTPIAESIRSVLKDKDRHGKELMDNTTQTLLMFAARRQLAVYINEMLVSNPAKTIVLDRWVFSTYVYQCLTMGFPLDQFENLVQITGIDTIVPNVVILMESTPITEPRDAIEEQFYEKRNEMMAHYRGIMDPTEYASVFPYYGDKTSNLSIVNIDGRTEDDVFKQICDIPEIKRL